MSITMAPASISKAIAYPRALRRPAEDFIRSGFAEAARLAAYQTRVPVGLTCVPAALEIALLPISEAKYQVGYGPALLTSL